MQTITVPTICVPCRMQVEGFTEDIEYRDEDYAYIIGKSRNAPAPATKLVGSTRAESARTRDQLANLGLSFDSFKRGVQRQTAPSSFSPTATLSASEYMRKRYGDFSGATVIETASPLETQTAIQGRRVVTIGDLKFLRAHIGEYLRRLRGIRSDFLPLKMKIASLDQITSDLDNVVGRVERKEIKLEEVSIDPRAAQRFIDSYQRLDLVPKLFGTRVPTQQELNENEYADEGIVLAPAPAPASALAPAALTPRRKTRQEREAEAKQLLYDNIQYAKWSAEADMDPRQAHNGEIVKRLKDMDARLFSYMASETPIPGDLYFGFTSEIERIQRALQVDK